jgi:hypothetical protein
MIKYLPLLILLSFVDSKYLIAQSTELVSGRDNLVSQAVSQLNTAMLPPDGELYTFASENKITGSFTFDLTFRKKGEMATVFVVSSENASIHMQNQLKDHLKAFRFDLTVPKGESRKFRHTFKF